VNRNIITPEDVARVGLERADATVPPGTPTVDDYWTRLLKYVPVEMIGSYLAIAGVLTTAYKEGTTGRQVSLAVLTVAGLIATWFFAQRVLGVVRTLQLAMTVAAFLVWVFATGGVFATWGWWSPGFGTIAVVAFAVAVRIVKVPALPEEKA